MQSADHKRVAFSVDFAGDEQVVVGVDFELVFDAVSLGAGAAAQNLRGGEFFTRQEFRLVDDSDSGDAGKERLVVGDGKPENGVREIVVDGDVQCLGQAVSGIGFLDDGELLPLAELVVELAGIPLARGTFRLTPTGFIDGELCAGKDGDPGADVRAGIGAGFQVVGKAEGLILNGDEVRFFGDFDRLGGGDKEGGGEQMLEFHEDVDGDGILSLMPEGLK